MKGIMEMAKRAAERPTYAELKAEIERLRTSLGKLYWQLEAFPVKHPQQADERYAARDLLDAAVEQRTGEPK